MKRILPALILLAALAVVLLLPHGQEAPPRVPVGAAVRGACAPHAPSPSSPAPRPARPSAPVGGGRSPVGPVAPSSSPRHLPVGKLFRNVVSDTLRVGLAQLSVPAGAMEHGAVLSITPLCKSELPPLPAGLVNVTGGDTISGYRFLPHGEHFRNLPASVTVPYDSTLLPRGYTAADIHTYYYDERHRRWAMLKHKGTDELLATVTAETSHFTDVINGVIKVPESPETSNYVPTSISGLKAADPMAGLLQVAAPTAIDGLGAASQPSSLYDLRGRRLAGQPTQRGVYVRGGKKVVVK